MKLGNLSDVRLPRAAIVIGTRPEATKLAPLAAELRCRSDSLETLVIATGQHRELLESAVQSLDIRPDRSLELMREGQTLSGLAARLLESLQGVYRETGPDLVIVQGDTTSTFIGALAAFHEGIPVLHVEAGLRSGDLSQPFPEEGNRRLVGQLAAIHCAPTERARENLLREGVEADRVHVTGNTAVDAFVGILRRAEAHPECVAEAARRFGDEPRLVAITCHRRESFGAPMARIFTAIRRLADAFPTRALFTRCIRIRT